MKTESGFEFKIEQEAFDDWELYEDLGEFSEGNSLKLPKIARRLLGEEQYEKLKEHCRKDGRITTTDMGNEINEMIALSGKKKS